MIRVLMWKEYREHRAIWLALALVSGGGLLLLSYLMGSVWGISYTTVRESLQSVSILFAWTYGLVCGAMLLANENEAGTMMFLDILPARRLQLWLVKYLFGVLLLLAQVAVLMGFVVGLGIADTPLRLAATLVAMLYFGMFSFSWSLLFSARGENVLNVIGLAFVVQFVGVILTTILLWVVIGVLALLWVQDGWLVRFVPSLVAALGLVVLPAVGSARLFTGLDRERRRLAPTPTGVRPAAALNPSASWRRLLWLSFVQMRRMAVGMIVFALAVGCILPLVGLLGWPVLTLLFGVLCGVTVWSDEQLSAAFRFLGDQRFPLGRIWIVKVGMRFALALLASFLLLVPGLVVALIHYLGAAMPRDDRVPLLAELFQSNLVGPVVPVFLHLLLWLLYGFTAGQLCSMLFRKSLVAAVVALGSAGMLACLWIPSLFGMGLHFWQVAGVPVCLLAASWLLMPAWTADRLLVRGTFMRLGSALLAAALWTAGGIWYRVAEVPDVPEPFDWQTFALGIPKLDPSTNPAGIAIRSVWTEVDHMVGDAYNKRAARPLFPKPPEGAAPNTFYDEMATALRNGWPDRPSDLDDWLDENFAREWYCGLLEAAYMPLGAVEDATQMTFDQPLGRGHNWRNLPRLNAILTVRGLQRQAAGDHWTFVDNLRISLALSRHLQYRSPPALAEAGRRGELIGVRALDHWLAKLPDYPDLLEHVRDILLEHEANLPNENDPNVTSYLIAHNSLESVPEKLVEIQIVRSASDEHAKRPFGREEQQKAEIEAAALFWRILWERERHERILRQAFRSSAQPAQSQAHKWGVAALVKLRQRTPGPRQNRDLALLRAAQLKVALRLYQARNRGKLPATLNALVPQYLPAVPIDPFDDRPFRYRISTGENLQWFNEPPPPPRQRLMRPPQPGRGGLQGAAGQPGGGFGPPKRVPPGQAILWSVGEDGSDNGGLHHQGLGDAAINTEPDLIYLVPLPPK